MAGRPRPPTATARLKEMLAAALKHGRAEMAKPRSGRDEPVEVGIAARDGLLLAATPADRRAARRSGRSPPGANGCSSPRPSARSSTSPSPAARPAPRTSADAPASFPAASSCSPTRPRASSAELVAARLRRARRGARPAARPRARAPARACSTTSQLKRADRRRPSAADRGGRRAARRPAGRPGTVEEHEDAVLAAARPAAARHAPARGPGSRPARRPPDPPAARRHGQVGRLPHRLRPPRPRLRGQRPRARAGGRRGAAGGRACSPRSRRSASATSTSTRAARPRSGVDRDGRGCHRVCGCRPSSEDAAHAADPAGQLATQVQTKLHTLVTLTRAGHRPPRAARPPVAHGARAAALGTDARRRLHRRRRAIRDEPAIIDELGTLTFKEVARAHQRARPRAARRRHRGGRRRRDHVPQPPRLDRRGASPAPSSAPTRCSSTRRSPARSSPTSPSARSPKAIVYDQEFAEVLADAGDAAQALHRLARPDEGKSKDPRLEDLIAARRHARTSRRRASRAGRSSSPRARRARRRAPRARCPSRSTRSPRCCR